MKRLKTEGIVLHRAEVWDGTDYHFIVKQDGSLCPLVPINERGEHAIQYNGNSVGIAIYGDFACLEKGVNDKPTPAQITSTVQLMQMINAMYGGKLWACGHSQLGLKGTNVPIKLTYGHTCPGENFPLKDVILKAAMTPLFRM